MTAAWAHRDGTLQLVRQMNEDKCREATQEIQRALRQRGLVELANDTTTIRRFAATRDYNVAATLELFVNYHGHVPPLPRHTSS